MATTTGEHKHCFCGTNTEGTSCCCVCRVSAGPTPRLNPMEMVIGIYQWVDTRLFFVNNHREHD